MCAEMILREIPPVGVSQFSIIGAWVDVQSSWGERDRYAVSSATDCTFTFTGKVILGTRVFSS